MIIEHNPPIKEFLITPAYKYIKIHLNNHFGIEISCINYMDYTIPLLSYFRKSSSPLVLVSSLDLFGFQYPLSFYSLYSCTTYLVTPLDLVTVC